MSNMNINKTPTLGITHNNSHTKKSKHTNKLIYLQTKTHNPHKHKIQIIKNLTRPHHTTTNTNSHLQIPISIKKYCNLEIILSTQTKKIRNNANMHKTILNLNQARPTGLANKKEKTKKKKHIKNKKMKTKEKKEK